MAKKKNKRNRYYVFVDYDIACRMWFKGDREADKEQRDTGNSENRRY